MGGGFTVDLGQHTALIKTIRQALNIAESLANVTDRRHYGLLVERGHKHQVNTCVERLKPGVALMTAVSTGAEDMRCIQVI